MMKKTISTAVAVSIFTVPAFSANLENPLYTPATGEFYSKTSMGVMYKKADHTKSLKAKNRDGKEEAPIWRYYENIGYGINDRLSVNFNLAYTNDEDIQRQGSTTSRVGVLYRIFDGVQSPFVWDLYADLHLGGLGPMKATVVPVSNNTALGFDYSNYANGRWGFYMGTKIGKTWDKFTGSIFGEIYKTFGNHNNEIVVSSSAKTLIAGMVTVSTGLSALGSAYANGLPGEFNVKTKSTLEAMTGVNGFYEINDKWSVGSGLSYKHRAANAIESVNLNNTSNLAALSGGVVTTDAITASLARGFIGTLDDGIDEYILTVAVSRKISDSMQVSVYADYTFDDAGKGSQNGSDIKAELGARLNVAF